MLERWRASSKTLLFGALVLAGTLVGFFIASPTWRDVSREKGFDAVLRIDDQLRQPPASRRSPRIVVVDIDSRSIESTGWPWPREKMADLLEAVSKARPRVVAIDILFAGPDTQSPAALARKLGAVIGRPDISALASELSDSDQRLAAAIASAPAVLGFVFDPEDAEDGGSLVPPPVMFRGTPQLPDLWRSRGLQGPYPALAARSAGLGALALPGDFDAAIRRVPLLIRTEKAMHPGLALETVRVSQQSAAYLISADPLRLTVGEVTLELTPGAFLRLQASVNPIKARSVSALDIVDGVIDADVLKGAIVLIGSSAPEAGGLRATPSDVLTPSVRIQAQAISQILARRNPIPWASPEVEGAVVALAGFAGFLIGLLLSPLWGTLAVGAMLLLGWSGATAASLQLDRLIDPLTPSLVALVVFAACTLLSHADTRRREARIRNRFAQHLAPSVVDRIVSKPELLKLSGERREITALFTDVEGFTAMTHRTEPETLVAALDSYFEGVTAIIIAHGGMVDKFVGDAVHAFFNAPMALPHHPQCAVECAIAIRAWTENYRRGERATAMGFGRTRVGVETGEAIVGDVGLRNKLDYTAHGDAVNMAARLEAANKTIGSTICIGPVAAARCPEEWFRPLGMHTVAGRAEPLALFEPWDRNASGA